MIKTYKLKPKYVRRLRSESKTRKFLSYNLNIAETTIIRWLNSNNEKLTQLKVLALLMDAFKKEDMYQLVDEVKS